jgi:hypothetical protein
MSVLQEKFSSGRQRRERQLSSRAQLLHHTSGSRHTWWFAARVQKLTVGLRRCPSWQGCNCCAGAASRALKSADDDCYVYALSTVNLSVRCLVLVLPRQFLTRRRRKRAQRILSRGLQPSLSSHQLYRLAHSSSGMNLTPLSTLQSPVLLLPTPTMTSLLENG